MDDDRFDCLARSLTAAGSRRRALALALGGALAPLVAREDAAAHDLLQKCKKLKDKAKRKKCLKKAKAHNAAHELQLPPPLTGPPPVDPCAGVSCGAVPHGAMTCRNGVCELTACDAGFSNCSGNPADGCETNSQTAPQHCGKCGVVCPGTDANRCAAGQCTQIFGTPGTYGYTAPGTGTVTVEALGAGGRSPRGWRGNRGQWWGCTYNKSRFRDRPRGRRGRRWARRQGHGHLRGDGG